MTFSNIRGLRFIREKFVRTGWKKERKKERGRETVVADSYEV
jgi:hypothetical protein